MQTSAAPAVDGNVTQATFLKFIEEYTVADQAVAEAIGMRKDLRKRIKGAGLGLGAFDRTRKEAEKAADVRDLEDREFRRNMAWLGKPLGFQQDWVGEPAQGNGTDDDGTVSEHQVHQVERAGLAAGKGGQDRRSNPWAQDSFLYQRWDAKWLEGQQSIAQGMAPLEQPTRRRGRPPGSRNKSKSQGITH